MELVKKPEEEMEALREAHKKRAAEIVINCAFAAYPISDRATEACRTIEMIFQEATAEIALMLPGEFRTALCLEHLENACMWAKKAIAAHDRHVTNLEKKVQNGPDNHEN